MKKILVITPEIPYPPMNGGRIDYYSKLLMLRQMGYQINLIFCYSDTLELCLGLPELQKLCSNILYFPRKKTIFRMIHPFIPYYVFSNQPNKNQVKEILNFLKLYCQDINVILFEQLQSYPIVKTIIKSKAIFQQRFKVIYRMHNIEEIFFKNLYKSTKLSIRNLIYFFDTLRFKYYEKNVIKKVAYIAAISRTEISWARDLNRKARIVWLPPIYKPLEKRDIQLSTEEEAIYENLKKRFIGKKVILLTGSFSGGFNVSATQWFIEKVLPFIHQQNEDIIFLFGGLHADKYFLDVETDKIVKFYNVPSVKPYIKLADINLIITNNSAGVKLKLIEALFYRKKVVSTTEGVYGSGLESLIPNTNEPQIFAQYCLKALNGEIDYSLIWNEFDNLYGYEKLKETFLELL